MKVTYSVLSFVFLCCVGLGLRELEPCSRAGDARGQQVDNKVVTTTEQQRSRM